MTMDDHTATLLFKQLDRIEATLNQHTILHAQHTAYLKSDHNAIADLNKAHDTYKAGKRWLIGVVITAILGGGGIKLTANKGPSISLVTDSHTTTSQG